ncbi:hypothetical protein OAT01_14725 [Pseudomonadales bacterium]|nr:hypothetical protein [Pseudomonadales bacterium]
MIKKIINIIAVVSFLSGCATALTPESRLVREINKDWQNECRFITTEQIWSTWKFGAKGNYMEVRNQIRIMTSELGGNAFVVGDFAGDGMGHYGATFEIYFCDKFNQQ